MQLTNKTNSLGHLFSLIVDFVFPDPQQGWKFTSYTSKSPRMDSYLEVKILFHFLLTWALMQCAPTWAFTWFWSGVVGKTFGREIYLGLTSVHTTLPRRRDELRRQGYWVCQLGIPIVAHLVATDWLKDVAQGAAEFRTNLGFVCTGLGGDIGFQIGFIMTVSVPLLLFYFGNRRKNLESQA